MTDIAAAMAKALRQDGYLVPLTVCARVAQDLGILPPERPAATTMEKITEQAIKAKAREADARCKLLLSAWVSEIEPEYFIGPNGMPIGIGAKGSGTISVPLGAITLKYTEGYP